MPNIIDKENDYRNIIVSEIFYDEKFNCRGRPDPMTCKDLADDIQMNGRIQPIVVQPYDEIDGKKWRILCGHRRFIAETIWLHTTVLPCKVNHKEMDVEQALIFNLAENVQRASLNIMQEANSIKHFFDKGLGAKEISEKLNLSYGWCQVRVMLLQLSPDVQGMADDELLTQTQIRDFFSMKHDVARSNKFIKDIKASKEKGTKHAVTAKVKGKETKRIRNKGEIVELQAYLARQFGHGLTTRVLAWCQGGITDGEMLATVKEICKDRELDYIAPVEGSLA